MRSYRQYCSVAKALDILGDRWTLLIVRELLSRGACRYTDLRDGLPGIATNLLAERLRELGEAGVIERNDAPPPVATTLFTLTERGRALEPLIGELARWGVPLMRNASEDDAFRGQWLRFPVRHFLTDRRPETAPCTVQVHAGDQTVTIDVGGAVSMRLGRHPDPDATVTGSPQQVLALLSGGLNLAQAIEGGLRLTGSRSAVERMLPDREADKGSGS